MGYPGTSVYNICNNTHIGLYDALIVLSCPSIFFTKSFIQPGRRHLWRLLLRAQVIQSRFSETVSSQNANEASFIAQGPKKYKVGYLKLVFADNEKVVNYAMRT